MFFDDLKNINKQYPLLKYVLVIIMSLCLFIGYSIGREYNKITQETKEKVEEVKKEEELKQDKKEEVVIDKKIEDEIIKENDKLTKIEIQYPDGTKYTKIEKDKSKEKENKKEEVKVEKVVEEKIVYKDKIEYIDRVIEKKVTIEPVLPKWSFGLGIKYDFNFSNLKDLNNFNYMENLDYGIFVDRRIYDNFWIGGGFYVKEQEFVINFRYEF